MISHKKESNTCNAYGVPRVVMPYAIYERCLGWMRASDSEVGWRGLADWNKEEFRITELFLPAQDASAAHVSVPHAKEGGDFGKWITECIRKGTYMNEEDECRYKWHMHKHPGEEWSDLFESGQDEKNTAEFGSRDIAWMMVGRAVGSGKFRMSLEIFNPYRVKIEHIPVFAEYKGDSFKVSEPGVQPHIEELEFVVPPGTALYTVSEQKQVFSKIAAKEKRIKEYAYSYSMTHTSNYNFLPELEPQYDFSPGYYTFFPWEEDISFPEQNALSLGYEVFPSEQNKIISPGQDAGFLLEKDTPYSIRNSGGKPKRRKKIFRHAVYKIKKTMELTPISSIIPKNAAYAAFQKKDGVVLGCIHFSVGPWDITTEPIAFDIILPEDHDIREIAKREAAAKVNVAHIQKEKSRKKKHRGVRSYADRGLFFKEKL